MATKKELIQPQEFYKCIGEEATYLLLNKHKTNLNAVPNKVGNIVLYHKEKYVVDVTPEFFARNFVKQTVFEEDDKSSFKQPATVEEAISSFKNYYDKVNRLILDCCEKHKEGTFTDRAKHNYVRDIRKICRYLDIIQPAIKDLKKKEIQNGN